MNALRAFSSSSVSIVVALLSSLSVSLSSSVVPAPLSQSLAVYRASGFSCLAFDSSDFFEVFVVDIDNFAISSDVMTPPEIGVTGVLGLWDKSFGARIILPPTSMESLSLPALTCVATLPRAPASSLSMNLSRASPTAVSPSGTVANTAGPESQRPLRRRLAVGSALSVSFSGLTSVVASEKLMNPSPIFLPRRFSSSSESWSSPSTSSSSTAPKGFSRMDCERTAFIVFFFFFFNLFADKDKETLTAEGGGGRTGAAVCCFAICCRFLQASRRFRFRSAAASAGSIV
mmetsp:Transcript_1998/g.4693  ORF Transcript_1998/g.4693 Transcript_1998/m.4693 type:complete len:288 (-) Transcript_1998:95-958(-)